MIAVANVYVVVTFFCFVSEQAHFYFLCITKQRIQIVSICVTLVMSMQAKSV